MPFKNIIKQNNIYLKGTNETKNDPANKRLKEEKKQN